MRARVAGENPARGAERVCREGSATSAAQREPDLSITLAVLSPAAEESLLKCYINVWELRSQWCVSKPSCLEEVNLKSVNQQLGISDEARVPIPTLSPKPPRLAALGTHQRSFAGGTSVFCFPGSLLGSKSKFPS